MWRIWIDTGGTFTDCIAVAPDGACRRLKMLSHGALRGRVTAAIDARHVRVDGRWPFAADVLAGAGFRLLSESGDETPGLVESFDPGRRVLRLAEPRVIEPGTPFEVFWNEEAPIVAARLATGTPRGAALPPITMRLATTRGTNALLERRGAPTALFITRGFGDLLLIGDQQRCDLFALAIADRVPLYSEVVEVAERLDAAGHVLEAIDLDAARAAAERLVAGGMRSAAVALMHGYRNPVHEQALARVLREAGFEHVSCSGELAPLIRILPRCETAVVNAYLAPVIEDYLRGVKRALAAECLHVMTSAGGLVRAGAYRAKDSLLSGPAGGVAGARAAGRRARLERVISFDMGGTSTDVAHLDGDYEYRYETIVGGDDQARGVRVLAPSLAIETVAAGGGSICSFEHGRLQVGPHSAGARPGPACYGAGGPLTLTDVNLLLGRLDPAHFGIPVFVDRARAALDAVVACVAARGSDAVDAEALLEGFLDIANERMAGAIEQISVRRGYDASDYALVAFGGAGPQHACAVADRIGADTILLAADASLLSATGLGHARVERFVERQVLRPLDAVAPRIDAWLADMEAEAADRLAREGVEAAAITVRRRTAHLRLLGQDATVEVDAVDTRGLVRAFAEAYEALYGHAPPEKAIEVESLRVVASAGGEGPVAPEPPADGAAAALPASRVRARCAGAWMEIDACDRAALRAGARITGPALILDRHTTHVIEPGWRAALRDDGAFLVERSGTSPAAPRSERPEIVRLELFENRLAAIAEEMGRMLERTAVSVNVKERLDFSCAVFDGDGELLVNAPHIPVHLGALGMCVRRVRDAIALEPGDVALTNHPAFGGSHLPDLTVIAPVFGPTARVGYVACRAHHAEIGGARPGSMPPAATTLAEEGVVIAPMHLVRGGRPCFEDVERVLRGGPHPSRAVADNLADLRAAVAALHRGAGGLEALVREHGEAEVRRRMCAIMDRAERNVRAAISEIRDGRYEAVEHLDDGSPIRVAVEVTGDRARIDFAGSAPVHPGNLNATPAIVRSAVIYVLRLLVGARLFLNEGLMRAVDVALPAGMLNPAFDADPAPAVVGGNVETSQRIVDTLLKAMNVCACSQGTMNNVLFGTDAWGYYETVGGGAGAGPSFDGAHAVHTHMTNTRLTDPEVLEHRLPVRLDRLAVRRGSGGPGVHRGGDGMIRAITFLQPVELSILSQHRSAGPYGAAGGSPGAPGRQRLHRASGETTELGAIDGCSVERGDRLVIETPGGGGWGRE